MQVKAKNKNAIVFYRVGDFYEVLGSDAQTVSKELNLILTGRSIGGTRVPMCGVPHHALQQYLAKLIQKGYKTAVAEPI